MGSHRHSCVLVVRHSCLFGNNNAEALAFRCHADRHVLLFPPIGLDEGLSQYLAEHRTSVFCQVQSTATSTGASVPNVRNSIRLDDLERHVMTESARRGCCRSHDDDHDDDYFREKSQFRATHKAKEGSPLSVPWLRGSLLADCCASG